MVAQLPQPTRQPCQLIARAAGTTAARLGKPLNHTMRLDDPLELFPTFIAEAGV
jgi:hypothetical protein